MRFQIDFAVAEASDLDFVPALFSPGCEARSLVEDQEPAVATEPGTRLRASKLARSPVVASFGVGVELLSALKVEELNQTVILAAVNERRTLLGLEPLSELGKDTSLKGGVASKPGAGTGSPKVSKTAAQSDLAQRNEVPFPEEVLAGVLDSNWNIDLSGIQTR